MIEVLSSTTYNEAMRISPYIKIDGIYYRAVCDKCFTPVKGVNAKLCRICYIDSIKGKVRVVHNTPHTQNTKDLISRSRAGKGLHPGVRFHRQSGERHFNYKGDDVGYGALHDYMKRRITKPTHCPNCLEHKRLSLANLSHQYTRDLNDWVYLCYKCHKNYDLGNIKLGFL